MKNGSSSFENCLLAAQLCSIQTAKMIPTTVSSSTSTATVSGATGNNHSTSNNGQMNMLLSTTPTASTVSSTATTPPAAQTPSVLLGLASLILEGRALADDEFQPQMMRTTAPAGDTSGLSGSGHGSSIGSGTSSSVASHLHNYNTSSLLANTSYGISGSGVGGIAVGGGRQSPTSRPSTSRAAAGFGGVVGSGHVINITTNPYAFNNSGVGAVHARDASPLYIDPYSANSSGSASSTAESTHQRWTQKLCQLRQVSPAANLSTTYEQPVAVEVREPEVVALAINESGANDRGDFEIVRRGLLNRTNLNAMSNATSTTPTVGSSTGAAGSASSSPGSGSDNFLLSLQSLATTCLRSGSPSLEPNHSGMSANSATSTPVGYHLKTLSSPSPPQSMYMYRATTPTASATATAHRFHEQPGSSSSCGSGVQSPRPHWPTVVDNLHAKERYKRHASAAAGTGFGSVRMPIPGTAVNTTTASVAVTAAATINHTTKVTPTTAATTTASKHPQQGPHCDQFLRKMGLAKGEAAEAEDHFCDMSYVNITCSRWRAYCHKMEAIIGRGEPVCIEVYLGPVNHKMLLEQWIITQKEKVPPPTMTLPSLCSAIRSQLYFSQISAWCDLIKKSDETIYDTGRIIFHKPTGAAGDLATPVAPVGSANAGSNITPGTSPNSHTLNNQLNNALSVNRRPRLNIFYRIKSFDSTACFNSKPNVHNFPNVNISENCSISVCLKSLPRINGGIPKIGTVMLPTPGTTMSTPTTTTAATAATVTTMPATATTTKATANKTKTTKAPAPATTATLGDAMSNSATRVAAIADATQRQATPNGCSNNGSSEVTTFRNGNSCEDMKSEETPRSSRPSRCVIAAAPTATSTSSTNILHTHSSATNSMSNAAGVSNGASCVSGSGKPRNDCGDTQDSSMPCSRDNKPNCAPKHKCVFFIDEDELLPVDEADGETYGEEDDNTSDAANSTGDSITNANAFCTGANMSHREKQLMKYRKRMLKRDKKHHQHHPRKPLTTKTTDATCELSDATYASQRAQQERDETNRCQPMEEGEEDDAAAHCSGDTMNTLLGRTSTRIEMISTGTQTPLSCCRQCGCEKTLVCMRCNSGAMHDELAIDEPTEPDVDDMDDSTASSLSSSEIIHTPRNKAELLLQAIQRTPKVAAAKHKKEQPRKLCGGKLQNNNHHGGVTTTHVNVGGKSSGSSLHENTLAGCQVCKRQKTQHNFGNSNGDAVTAANANTNEHLVDEAGNDDIGDADTDDDGGKQVENMKFVAESVEDRQLPVTPLTALPTRTQIMEEESFMSSTKLTPQIDRCTLSNTSNAARYPLLTSVEHAGGDQKVEGCERSENRTPPTITTLMDGERFDESQFKTPTTIATGGVNYDNSPQLKTQQRPQSAHKAFQHKQTPKPNLLQLRCTYHSVVNAESNQAVGAAGDGFAVVRANNNNELPTALKSHKEPQPHGVYNALLLRKGLPKVNLTPIFCNPMPSPTGAGITSSHSSPIPIHGAANDITFNFEPSMRNRSGHQLQLHHQLMHSSSGNVCASPLTTEVNNIPVQKSYSAPTLPNSPSLSPRFAKQAALYKRRSRHLSDRSERSSLGSDEQYSDEDLESAGMYSPATSPLKQSARVAAAFGRLPLLGNLEESLLQKRLMPKVEVMGFTVLLGASGGFCPTQLTIPAASYFYELRGESLSTPYMCEIRLPRKGYSVPRAGNVQATLLNPMGTVVRMFVIPYDMRDMPPLHQTFIRQRILAEASTHEATTQNVQSSTTQKMEQQSNSRDAMSYTNGYGGGGRGAGGDANLRINNNNGECYQTNNKCNNGNANNNAKNKYRLSPSGGLHGESNLGHFISAENMKRLRYSIHLRFQTSRSGRLSLHTDIRLLISRRTDCDTAAAHAKGVLEAPNDLVTDTVMPTNPKYSPRQDQSISSSNNNGSGSGSGGSNGSNLNAIAATNSTTITTNNNNNGSGSGSNKI